MDSRIIFLMVSFCYSSYVFCANENSILNSVHVVDDVLDSDISVVPSAITGNATDIAVELFLTQMRSVQTEEVDYTFYLYQGWEDPRLKWGNQSRDYYVVKPNQWKRMWLPDTYIENELKSFMHDISSQNKFIWVFANGTVVYGIRLTATISCKFGAMKFPLAYFVCRLKFRVHSYEARDVRLHWFQKAIDFAEDFAGDNIEMVSWKTRNCTMDRSSVIINSCLEVRMLLRKNFGSTALRTYLPSFFIIVVGWLSFWIDRKEVSARVKLGTLVLLAMITEEVGMNLIVPSGVDVSALDVWFVVLLSYTTVAMVEFTIVHAIDRYQKKLKLEKEQRKKTPELMDSIETISNNHPDAECSEKRRYELQIDEQPLTDSTGCFYRFIATVSTGKIEKYARILYLITFAIFQIFYWGFYLTYTEIVL